MADVGIFLKFCEMGLRKDLLSLIVLKMIGVLIVCLYVFGDSQSRL